MKLVDVIRPLAKKHRKLRNALLGADMRIALLKHTAAGFLPGIIKPDVRNLTIAVTSRCNLRCLGCRYGRDFMVGHELPWSIMKAVLDDAKALGIKSVRFYGGEPLLHRDLPRFIGYASSLGLRPYITTNGILLKERIAELYDSGLRAMTVGFYGTGDSYDSYVQLTNRFSQFEEGLATVRELYGNGISIQLNWLLSRRTCTTSALKEAVRFAQTYSAPIQVDLIHYSLPYFTEGPDRELQFRPNDVGAISNIVNELLRLKGEFPSLIGHSEMGLRSITDWLIKGPAMKIPCDKYQMMWIGADGTVQLCYVTFTLGNLHQQRLAKLLYDDAHRSASHDCFALKCPNCHCGYDTRVQKHLPSRRLYGVKTVSADSLAPIVGKPSGGSPDAVQRPPEAVVDIPVSMIQTAGSQEH